MSENTRTNYFPYMEVILLQPRLKFNGRIPGPATQEVRGQRSGPNRKAIDPSPVFIG